VEVVLSHVNVGVAYDALDGRQIDAKGLHLRHIGVSAAMRSQDSYFRNLLELFFEFVSEVGRVTRRVDLLYFPYVLFWGLPKIDSTVPNILRNGDGSVTVSGLGSTHHYGALYEIDCLTYLMRKKHYADEYGRTGYFAAVNKGSLFAFAIDGKDVGSFVL